MQMLRLHLKWKWNVSGQNIGRTFCQSLQCSQHVNTHFHRPSPPVWTKSAFHKLSNIDEGRWVLLHSKKEAAVLYGIWISKQEDWIRLKSSPSTNDETTYLVLVLIEDKRWGLPVELDDMTSSIDMLASSQHDDRKRCKRREDERMSSRYAVKRWGLLADFDIP